jgi:ribosomal-protein-alanine N-acetyltransferase
LSHNEESTPLHSERVILREWRDADLPAFASLNADPRVMKHLPETLTRIESDQFASRIRTHFDEHGFGLWAVEVPGIAPFIGFVGLSVPTFDAHFTPCVEVGWRIATAYWNKGYATEAAQVAVSYGCLQQELSEIVASRRVMEKLGMTHDPTDDFDHPKLAEGHPLRRHVLYRLKRATWRSGSDGNR